VPLDPAVKALATGKNFAALPTLFAAGSPQTQVMWVDADDDNLLINTEVHRAKFHNTERDPRVSVLIWDQDSPYKYAEVRGRVTDVIRGPEARAHIDACSERYMDKPYDADRIQSERAILVIAPDKVITRAL
jgi:PPOX class probable F420-dependent enzyme